MIHFYNSVSQALVYTGISITPMTSTVFTECLLMLGTIISKNFLQLFHLSITKVKLFSCKHVKNGDFDIVSLV